MDADLFLIFSFILLGGMIVLGWVSMMAKRTAQHDERVLKLKARKEEAERGTGGPDVRALEDRVRVLERIATDRGQDVAMQIEQLRDDSAGAPITPNATSRQRQGTD